MHNQYISRTYIHTCSTYISFTKAIANINRLLASPLMQLGCHYYSHRSWPPGTWTRPHWSSCLISVTAEHRPRNLKPSRETNSKVDNKFNEYESIDEEGYVCLKLRLICMYTLLKVGPLGGFVCMYVCVNVCFYVATVCTACMFLSLLFTSKIHSVYSLTRSAYICMCVCIYTLLKVSPLGYCFD